MRKGEAMPRYIVFDPQETEHLNAHILASWDKVEEWLKDGSIRAGYLVFEIAKAWDAIKEEKINLIVAKDIT